MIKETLTPDALTAHNEKNKDNPFVQNLVAIEKEKSPSESSDALGP